jgi:NAD(P)-dependent dehydrogenase (short-subunit alcohol dehydrogenase family)
MIRTYSEAVTIVTGGASGIGAALVRGLARHGALVVIADRQKAESEEIAAEAERLGGKGEAVELDVRDADAVEALVADVYARHGRLDYLFNNAGIGIGGEVIDCDLEDWRYIVEINLMGVIHGVQAAYPRMVAQGFGHIVNTASMAGWIAGPMSASYNTTKHAVVGLSRSLRIEAATYGVRVSVLCPGVIRTAILSGGRYGRMKKQVPEQVQLAMFERTRPMDPNDLAERVLADLARDESIMIYPRRWRLLWWINQLAPRLTDRLSVRLFRNVKAEIERAETDSGKSAG